MTAIIKDRITAQLETIESVYGVTILNKSETAQWIADRTDDDKMALTIATALNTWVMTNQSDKSIKIPFSVLGQIHNNLTRKESKQS